jgi:hypothetical protein
MHMLALPSRNSILILWGATAVLAALAFAPSAALPLGWLALALGGIAILALALDAALSHRRWQRAPLLFQRQLPQAFAIGLPNSTTMRMAAWSKSICRYDFPSARDNARSTKSGYCLRYAACAILHPRRCACAPPSVCST